MKNKKGFTLIELLAVITIMGILMLVAIPAVSRTIENSRKDTFVDTAKSYINAIKNAVSADELYQNTTPISAVPEGYYYYGFDTASGNTASDLMEQGGKSSWGNANVKGYIAIHKTVTDTNTKYEYAIRIIDDAKRGITSLTLESKLDRSSVKSKSTISQVNAPSNTDEDKFDGTKLKKDDNCKQLTLK